jgi:flagellin
MGVNIGDISSRSVRALEVQKALVTSREAAARNFTIIDNCSQTAASTNLKSSESHIRDADEAKEMIEFTKLNMTSQADNSLLA